MFSTTECKKRLGKNNYSEREIEEIRDCLYQLASLLVDDYVEKRELGKANEKEIKESGE